MRFDRLYDEMLHDEFRSRESSRGKHRAPETAGEEHVGPRGLSRYRSAVMVGAGGLACAGIGAFLGGLGGSFTVNPAAARSVDSSGTRDRRSRRRSTRPTAPRRTRAGRPPWRRPRSRRSRDR